MLRVTSNNLRHIPITRQNGNSEIDEIKCMNIQNNDEYPLAKEVKSALFEASMTENLNPIHFEINESTFKNIVEQYISIIREASSYSERAVSTYGEYLGRFNFKYHKVKVTVFPAFSKDDKCISYNISGDASIQIETPDGVGHYFVFDAPSIFSNVAHCLNVFDVKAPTELAMHAKILFLLHICDGQKEFSLWNQGAYSDSHFPDHLVKKFPYVWATQDDKVVKFKINGDCNVLLKYRSNSLILLSAGQINQGSYHRNHFINLYKELYERIGYIISEPKHIASLERLTTDYKKAMKYYKSPEGGFSKEITVPLEINGYPVKFFLVTDGFTDNIDLEKLIINNMSQTNHPMIMDKIREYMIGDPNKPDDSAILMIQGKPNNAQEKIIYDNQLVNQCPPYNEEYSEVKDGIIEHPNEMFSNGKPLTGRDIRRLSCFNNKQKLINESLLEILKYLNSDEGKTKYKNFVLICKFVTILLQKEFCASIPYNELNHGVLANLMNQSGTRRDDLYKDRPYNYVTKGFDLSLDGVHHFLIKNVSESITKRQAFDLCVILTNRHESRNTNKMTTSGMSILISLIKFDTDEGLKQHYKVIEKVGHHYNNLTKQVAIDLSKYGLNALPRKLRCIIGHPDEPEANDAIREIKHNYKHPLAEDIKSALFETSKTENLNPINFEIKESTFNQIVENYIGIISEKFEYDKSYKELIAEYSKYLKSFTLRYPKLKITVFPAYSEDDRFVSHNISGDASMRIETSNGIIHSFLFDSPSTLYLHPYFLNVFSFRDSTAMAMHAKLIFLLHVCDGRKEFFSLHEKYPDYLVQTFPHVWGIQNEEFVKFKINGDCNVLLKYRYDLIFMSAGYIDQQNRDSDYFIKLYDKFYKERGYTIEPKDIKQLSNLSTEYKNAIKGHKSIRAATLGERELIIPWRFEDYVSLSFFVVPDGVIDNIEYLKDSITNMSNRSEAYQDTIMYKIQELMLSLDGSESMRHMHDDCAAPLLIQYKECDDKKEEKTDRAQWSSVCLPDRPVSENQWREWFFKKHKISERMTKGQDLGEENYDNRFGEIEKPWIKRKFELSQVIKQPGETNDYVAMDKVIEEAGEIKDDVAMDKVIEQPGETNDDEKIYGIPRKDWERMSDIQKKIAQFNCLAKEKEEKKE